MKKIAAILVFGMFMAATSALAAVSGGVQTGTLEMGDPTDVDKGVRVGLSPKVSATYINEGTDAASSQWFAIGAMHPGGDTAYATAQDLSNVWKQEYVTGTPAADLFALIPTTEESAIVWSDNEWSK